jgi:hypothetical protein
VYLETADVAVIYHTIPTTEAVKILQAFGIDTHHSEMPLTPKLNEHLVNCEKAMQSAKPILGRLFFSDDYRTVTVIGFTSILVEYHEAVMLLVTRSMIGSAFALGRPIVEGMYRGLWLNVCATEDELNRFIKKDEIRLTLGQIAEALDPAYNTGDLFQQLKKRAWDALNSYTHTGMMQLGRRFTKHEVKDSYTEEQIYEMTTSMTTCVLLLISRFLAKQGHPDEAKQIDALIETYGPALARKALSG